MSEPAVLIVEDDANLREALFDSLSADAVNVLTADCGAAALDIVAREHVGLVISDLQMQPMDGATLLRQLRTEHPTLPAVLMTAHGSVESAVEVMRGGAADYLLKPFASAELRALVDKYLRPAVDVDQPVAEDPASLELLRVAARVAATEATVTISGESGAGKEVYARYIHACSSRAAKPFVAINCAAIPENMLEAVLFGYEKGAFTGAVAAHAGKFEQANGGTLLLDEISEMDIGLQAKLLRVLQEQEVERIGGRKLVQLDVRVLATTNRNLRQQVDEGGFREDLFYRLNVFPLHVPALRERPGDILPLATRFLARSATRTISLTADAEQRLLGHAWPGNVRELDNLIQRSLILASGSELEAADLAFEAGFAASPDSDTGLQQGLECREFQMVADALTACSGRRSAAAKSLGISPRTLRYKLARMRERGLAIPGDSHE